MDYIQHWKERAETTAQTLLGWLGLASSKFHLWKVRYGKANEHNGKIPRDHWLAEWEKRAILDFHDSNPLEGYRRLTFMMLDREIVAVSPAADYRVLDQEARRKINAYVVHYNEVRLHSALGYITPAEYLAGKATEIYAAMDRKLEAARAKRKQARQELFGIA